MVNGTKTTVLKLKDNTNYIMDIGGTGPLKYGNGQYYTIGLVNPSTTTANKKAGYFEVIIDMNMAKSILDSEVKKDPKLLEYIQKQEATPPNIYGKHASDGLNFFLVSKKERNNDAKGVNFGRCSITGNDQGEDIDKNKQDATARQFKVIIPDNECKTAKCDISKNIHYLTVRTDSKYTDCQTKAPKDNDATKSHIYGIRISVKHSNEPYVGLDDTGTINNYTYTQSDAKSTYNLPTLIIGREDALPSYCTQAMIDNGAYACKKENGYGVDRNAGKRQLLWAACGASDIQDEMDCRKPGANCNNRINVNAQEMITWAEYHRRNNRDDKRLTTYMYPKNSPYPLKFIDEVTNTVGTYKCENDRVQYGNSNVWANHFQCVNEITYDGNGKYRSTDKNTYNRYAWGGDSDYPQWSYAEPKKLFVFNGSRANNGAIHYEFEGKCWKDWVWNSSIYSGGYLFVRKQIIQGGTADVSRDDSCWITPCTAFRCDAEGRQYQYHVKAPKIFTISLRDFEKKSNLRILDKNTVSNLVKNNSARDLAEKVFVENGFNVNDHQNLPGFEAKFRIVNASTNAKEAPKKYYFKKNMNCWLLTDKGVRSDKELGNSITDGKGRVKVEIEGTEDEPTFTIKSNAFSSDLKGYRIQCQLDFSDYTNVKDHGNKYKNQPFKYAGLYKNFAYNIQLASLKILNTQNAHYKDLALSTRCDFATYWDAFPGNVVEGTTFYGQNDKFEGATYIARKPFLGHESKRPEGNADESNAAAGPNLSSKTRHFRFEARPLYYTTQAIQNELYAGYKYPENSTKNAELNSDEELKFLYDINENEKLKSINFNKANVGQAQKITLKPMDADGNEIKGLKLKANLKGIMSSIYARYDELSTTEIPSLGLVNEQVCYEYKNGKCTTQAKTPPQYIDNCFTANICRSVWGDLNVAPKDLTQVGAPTGKPTDINDATAFIYTDNFESNRYLAYDNAGKTILVLRDSDYTLLSQSLKGTHSNENEPLCAPNEIGSVYRTYNNDATNQVGHGNFRTKGKRPNITNAEFNKLTSEEKRNFYLYGCDIAIVDNAKKADNGRYDFDKAEWQGVPYYTFKPAMIKINAVLGSGALNNNPYHSNKFIYNRAKCDQYSDPTNCDDNVESSAFKIQVGAASSSRADIEANNFLSRYDGTAKTSQRVLALGGVLNPIIAHQKFIDNDILVKDDFNFKLQGKNLTEMLLAPKCTKVIEINGDTGAIKLRESCKSGASQNNDHYIAIGNGGKILPIDQSLESKYGRMNANQSYWQDLVKTPATKNKAGLADITMYANGFINGVSELKNVKKGDATKGEQDQEIGLTIGQGIGKYSLKPAEPVRADAMLEDVNVTTEKPNEWLAKKGVSVMSDSFGAAVILDVTLIAPNKQIGINKDNAVFLAAYSSDKDMAKALQDDGILGDIIPGYANYYRIRREVFSNALQNSLFDYENASLGYKATNMQSGDFLTIDNVDNLVKVKLLGDDKKIARTYCNFIRECYPLDDVTFGTVFRGFANKDTNWSKDSGQGSTILDKARTRPTQKRIAW